MLIKCLPVGQLETNCYVVTDGDTLECAVIDPGDECNTVLNYIEELGLKCRYVFLTHGHYDHTTAAWEVSNETGAVICINRKDVSADGSLYSFDPPEDAILYKEGDSFTVGRLSFRVMETPGHSPGSVTLICGDALFTGDTLFRDSCGRFDLPGGDMQTLLRSLRRIGTLDGEFDVYPGHSDSSTLRREIRFNQYMHMALGR